MNSVTIITAQALTKEQLLSAQALVEKKLGKVTIVQTVDPTVLGGIQIKIGSQTFDATIAGKLEKIAALTSTPLVTTAVPLTDAQKKKIQQALTDKLGSGAFEEKIDTAILGGIKITVGSKEYDATIQNKLERIKQHMVHTA